MSRVLFLIVLVASIPAAAASLPFRDDFDSYDNISQLTSEGSWTDVNRAFTLESSGCAAGQCIKVVYAGSAFLPAGISLSAAPVELFVRFKFKVSDTPYGGIKFFKAFGLGYSESNYANFTVNYGSTTATESGLSAWCFGDWDDALHNDTAICIKTPGSVAPSGYDAFTWVANNGAWWYATPGTWHTVEIYGRHSTGTDTIAYDGEFKLTVDGRVLLHVVDVKNRGNLNARGFERVAFGDFGNDNANMEIWFDDIEISDHPLDAQGPAPSAPANLNAQ